MQSIQKKSKIEILYTLKSLMYYELLETMVNHGINGFSVSSLFEAQFAKEVLKEKGSIHITSPGLRLQEIEETSKYCDYITFNSESQYRRFAPKLSRKIFKGLRVNPMISFVGDKRYDPCCKNSKLGIPIVNPIFSQPELLSDISGLHFHSNCESDSFSPLLETVQRVCEKLHFFMKDLEWINLGGGYLYDMKADYAPFFTAAELLNSKYKLKVFIEPGAALVSRAGFIVSSVVDLFSNGKNLFAVLDTTVNHMPEVYEYRFQPTVLMDNKKGNYPVFLVGSSCLAGDIFGKYRFKEPLKIGSRIVFLECGAYTLVKAHMFNGINLPTQYLLEPDGRLLFKKKYTYQDFLSRIGGDT